MALLEVSNLGIAFGGLQAVDKVDLTIEEGALCGLIGPNGAGKTTVFNMLTGVYRPTEGDIILNGKNITGQSPASICKAGIAPVSYTHLDVYKRQELGGDIKVVEFVRFEKGEGLEKREDDFAAEVASMMK